MGQPRRYRTRQLTIQLRWLVVLILVLSMGNAHAFSADQADRILAPRNTEVPFCYKVGGTRHWPVFVGELGPHDSIELTALRDRATLGTGQNLHIDGLAISLSREGRLRIDATQHATAELRVELFVQRDKHAPEKQTIQVRPAPPNRPISYISDLLDDLIRIFWDSSSQKFRPVTRDSFDQYFRRLQAQGITRLIVWPSAFPVFADPNNYDPKDWDRFARQARAILDCESLQKSMRETPPLKSYEWQSMLMRMRMDPEFDRMFATSAKEHGIRLTVSFRPFEAALTKYYEVPAFDADGNWLWGFLPGASPAVNYHPDAVSFAHYREILRRMNRRPEAQLAAIEIDGVSGVDTLADRLAGDNKDLELIASPVPPLDEQSYVLLRQPAGDFELVLYGTVRDKVESQWIRLTDAKFRIEQGTLIIDHWEMPDSHRFLLLRSASEDGDNIQLPVIPAVTLRAAAGNQLGRSNVYCSLAANSPEARATRVAGIPPNGLFRTEFQAIENSIDYFRKTGEQQWRLGDGTLVIDVGQHWSVEMTDFNRPAARDYAVRELRTILSHESFDEIMINTRSHTQLSASTGDGEDGVHPMAYYRVNGKNYYHYGIDRAFAPISMADNEHVRAAPTEDITTWQVGEWIGPCQTADSRYLWRYQRNREIARGIRALLKDLEREFQDTRIRVVIPESESVIRGTQQDLAEMSKPGGGVYGRDYYRHIRGSLNHIPAIGEGMAMVNLEGLAVEPVFLGIRFAPDQGPLAAFLDRSLEDLADNRGSSFRGPKSFFYEAQETLRGQNATLKRPRREEIICDLLKRESIKEVLLYEAADWTYYLPLSNRDLSSHAFLDRCLP